MKSKTLQQSLVLDGVLRMQMQRHLRAKLETQKVCMEHNTDMHSMATLGQVPVAKATKSTTDTRIRAASASCAGEGKDGAGEHTTGDGDRACQNDGHTDGPTVHMTSIEAFGAAHASPAEYDFAEGQRLQEGARQGSADERYRDPLMSIHDLGAGCLPDGLAGAMSDEQGANGIGDLNMPMRMPEWGDPQVALGDVEYGDLFACPDSIPNVLESELPDQEPTR